MHPAEKVFIEHVEEKLAKLPPSPPLDPIAKKLSDDYRDYVLEHGEDDGILYFLALGALETARKEQHEASWKAAIEAAVIVLGKRADMLEKMTNGYSTTLRAQIQEADEAQELVKGISCPPFNSSKKD